MIEIIQIVTLAVIMGLLTWLVISSLPESPNTNTNTSSNDRVQCTQSTSFTLTEMRHSQIRMETTLSILSDSIKGLVTTLSSDTEKKGGCTDTQSPQESKETMFLRNTIETFWDSLTPQVKQQLNTLILSDGLVVKLNQK